MFKIWNVNIIIYVSVKDRGVHFIDTVLLASGWLFTEDFYVTDRAVSSKQERDFNLNQTRYHGRSFHFPKSYGVLDNSDYYHNNYSPMSHVVTSYYSQIFP